MGKDIELAILFADVVGSTRIYEVMGDLRARDMVLTCVEIMRAATRGARGAVVGATMAAPSTLERRVRALLAGPAAAPPRPRSGLPLLLAGAVLIYALGTLAPCASAW